MRHSGIDIQHRSDGMDYAHPGSLPVYIAKFLELIGLVGGLYDCLFTEFSDQHARCHPDVALRHDGVFSFQFHAKKPPASLLPLLTAGTIPETLAGGIRAALGEGRISISHPAGPLPLSQDDPDSAFPVVFQCIRAFRLAADHQQPIMKFGPTHCF